MILWAGNLGWAQLGGFPADAGWAHSCVCGQLLAGETALFLELIAGLCRGQWGQLTGSRVSHPPTGSTG